MERQGLTFNHRSQEGSDSLVLQPPEARAQALAWGRPMGCGSAENIKSSLQGEFRGDTDTWGHETSSWPPY